LKSSSGKPKKDKYPALLYGHDPEPGIVAVEPIQGESMVEVFSRGKSGQLKRRYEKSKAFFYTNHNEPALDKLWDDGTEIFDLEGDLHFNTLVETNNIRTAWWFRKNAEKGNVYIPRERGQYLISTGKTLFKDMKFDDVVRMYMDIETYTMPGYKFSNPAREGDKITIISIKTNQKKNNRMALVLDDDGWSEQEGGLFDTNAEAVRSTDENTDFLFFGSEEELLKGMFVIINDVVDPDVIVNHNIFNFDLWYIWERCRLLDIRMEIGRDYTVPNVYDSKVSLGEKDRDIICFEAYGRHIIDTDILARQVDSVARKYENYQLKYLVREIKEEREGRIIIPGGRIARAWDGTDPDYNRFHLISYAIDDAEDAQKLDHAFGRAVFESTQFTPYPYQDVFRLATGGKSETLFLRHYYHNNHSLDKPEKVRNFGGGLSVSRMEELGIQVRWGLILDESILIDVKSLYPTIGIEHGIQPKGDVLGFYQKIIRLFREFRYSIKDQIEGADQQTKIELKSTDMAIKVYLNTIAYGYLGSAFSLFNDYDEAERITEIGQSVLADMVEKVETQGGTFIRGDTDGAVVIPPKKYTGSREKNQKFVDKINDRIDKFEIGLDGVFQSVLVVDGKSYAYLDDKGKTTLKGDTIKSRRKENFVLRHLKETITDLLRGHTDVLEKNLSEWTHKIKNRQLTEDDVIQYQELKEPLETYRTKVELGSGNGGRNADAAYEIACGLEEDGMDIKVGDRIEFYVEESPMTLSLDGRTGKLKEKKKYTRVCDMAQNIDHFRPEKINIKHYLKRLYDSSEPIYMLFWPDVETLKKMGFSMRKNRREKLETKKPHIYNQPLT
jgi:DNA polymerase, archaea type